MKKKKRSVGRPKKSEDEKKKKITISIDPDVLDLVNDFAKLREKKTSTVISEIITNAFYSDTPVIGKDSEKTVYDELIALRMSSELLTIISNIAKRDKTNVSHLIRFVLKKEFQPEINRLESNYIYDLINELTQHKDFNSAIKEGLELEDPEALKLLQMVKVNFKKLFDDLLYSEEQSSYFEKRRKAVEQQIYDFYQMTSKNFRGVPEFKKVLYEWTWFINDWLKRVNKSLYKPERIKGRDYRKIKQTAKRKFMPKLRTQRKRADTTQK